MASTDILKTVERIPISNNLTPDLARHMLRTMVRIRTFETRTMGNSEARRIHRLVRRRLVLVPVRHCKPMILS